MHLSGESMQSIMSSDQIIWEVFCFHKFLQDVIILIMDKTN